MTAYQRAVLMIIMAGAFLSTAGIGIRLLEVANGIEVVMYRAFGMAVFLFFALLWRDRGAVFGKIAGVGAKGLLAAVFYAGASFSVVFGILNTTVANVMFIISLTPFIAAILGRVILGEAVGLRTWLAIAAATLGVLIMVGGGLSREGLIGIAWAFSMTICYALFTITLRSGGDRDMLPSVCVAGVIVTVGCLFLVEFRSLPTNDVLIMLGLGVFQTGLGALLMVLGSRHVPAAQIAFLAMLEVVLSPVWVWLGVGERPAPATLVGGAVIMAAIAWQALGSLREAPSP